MDANTAVPEAKQPLAIVDPATNTFQVDPVEFRRTPEGDVARDEQGAAIVERVIGHFVFRVPTLSDMLEIGVRRAARLRGMSGVVDQNTEVLAMVLSTLPFVAVEVPKGWDWAKLYPKDMEAVAAVYEAYNAGLERF